MEESPHEQKPLSLGEMIFGTILYPSEALSEIARQRPWAWTIIFIILISVVLAYALQALAAAINPKAQFSFSIVEIIAHIAYALLSLAVFTGLVHVIGRQWYDEGSYGGTFCALAFTGVPFILAVFLSIPIILLGIGPPKFCVPFLGNCGPILDPTAGILVLSLNFAATIWMIVLGVIAVQQGYGLTTREAIVTYIIAAVAHGVLFWLFDWLKEVFK